jgi:hypothetical protein
MMSCEAGAAVLSVETEAWLTVSVDGGSDESHLRRAHYAAAGGPTEPRAIPGRVQSHGAADQCAQMCKSNYPTSVCVGASLM